MASSSSSSAAAAASSLKKNRSRTSSADDKKNPKRWKSSPFTDFGSYMVEKSRKLREQFDTDASTSSLGGDASGDAKGLFHGVSIFVDGFTVPSSQELRAYMLRHGGRFENYFSRHLVTHIICSNLPDSKMRNFRAFSKGLPVVKPAWVLDSVASNKLLSWVPYQLNQMGNEHSKQKKLSTFFTSKKILRSEDVDTSTDPGDKLDTDDKQSKQMLFSSECERSESREKVTEQRAHLVEEEESDDRENAGPEFNVCDDEHSVAEVFENGPSGPSSAVNSAIVGSSSDALSLKCPKPSYHPHSTHTDPDFVHRYFKKSRLHFIGTWRNRYRKHFCNIQHDMKESNAAFNSLAAPRKTAIIHIDMDCFFVSVIARNYPELLDKPVAVCHSDNPKGTAEVSSANYPARSYGIRAGMFVRDAKVHCPHIVIVPYDFKAYEEVADQFYSILHKHCSKVQALSCDEAFLDVTGCCNDDPEELALVIRKEIAETTRCTASAGIAGNLLLARLATRSAKPNGQYFISLDKVDNFLKDLPIKSLPGIGHSLGEKLQSRQIQTCGQLLMIPKESLHRDFGTKTGDMLWNYCRGVDNRTVDVVQETKSVGAEVNWGVRFNDIMDSQNFLLNLCKEVSLRLQGCGVRGRTITLKVKKRKKGAAEPTKFMGCGDCESFSRSVTLSIPTDDIAWLQRISKQIFSSFHFDVKEVRGVGLQISRLENADTTRQGHDDNKLEAWLASASEKTGEQHKEPDCLVRQGVNVEALLPSGESKKGSVDSAEETVSGSSHIDLFNRFHGSTSSTLPPLCHLDVEVINNLPQEIFSEINDMYNGKLLDLIEKHKEWEGIRHASLSSISTTDENEATSSSCCKNVDGVINTIGEVQYGELDSGERKTGEQPLCSSAFVCDVLPKSKGVNYSCQVEFAKGNNVLVSMGAGVEKIDLMPASLSQADISVLQQLPEDLKVNIYELLPVHRPLNSSGNASSSLVSKHLHDVGVQNSGNSRFYLWEGDPPIWVEKFKACTFLILNLLANVYSTIAKDGLLSSAMYSLVSFFPLIDSSSGDETVSSLSDLLRQYIYLNIESHIEELYSCFQLLKRFSSMSRFFLEVYSIVLPVLQVSVRENYGGELSLSLIKE